MVRCTTLRDSSFASQTHILPSVTDPFRCCRCAVITETRGFHRRLYLPVQVHTLTAEWSFVVSETSLLSTSLRVRTIFFYSVFDLERYLGQVETEVPATIWFYCRNQQLLPCAWTESPRATSN